MRILIYIFLFFFSNIYPNEKSSIEIQNEIDSRNTQIHILKREIAEVEKNIINKTKDEIATSEIIIELQNKINLTEKLIKSMEREEKLIQRKIDKSYIAINEKEKRIDIIQQKMKDNAVYAYKRGIPTLLESLFNIDNFNDITYKVKYLNVFNHFQNKTEEQLKLLVSNLNEETKKLQEQIKNKKIIKKNKNQEKKTIELDIMRKNELLVEIGYKKEKDKIILTKKQKSLEDIESLMKKLYSDKKSRQKREKQLAEIRKIQKLAVNGNFNAMKGKLPWPIKGKIISKFGSKRNKKLNTITENLGIDIKSSKDETVIAVLDGVVSTITYVRGHGNIIILDHGDGFNTVYSNIQNIAIKENDYVTAGKSIAEVEQDMILHFEIWGNQKKMNPETWLIK